MKTRILFHWAFAAFCLTLVGNNVFAQAPNISYAPSTEVYTINTVITGPTLTNSGGVVAAFAFGPGVALTGATLSNPYGMGIDPTTGNIYVVNIGNNTVSKYNSSGTFITNAFFNPGTSSISNPAGITFDASGNAYLLNYNHTNNGQGNFHGNAYVDQYNSSGIYQSTIVQGLGTANGITSDLSNNLYIAQGSYNGGNNTVSQYNTLGALAFTTGTANTVNPVAVAVDGAGDIYALDNTNKNVIKFNSSGTYVSTLITGFTNPNAICTDGAGNIYVGDSGTGGGTGSVKVYNSAGTLLTTIAGLTDPEGLVTDANGNLYVSDYTNNTVTKYPAVGGYHLSSALFAGLSFNSATGVFSGTPTTPFNATNYTVTAYNASGSSTSNIITLSCPPNLAAPDISYVPSINVFTIGTAITLAPTNGGGFPTSWTINPSAAALLAATGLTFNTTGVNAGTFSGTPTKSAAATVYTVTASNASGSSSATVSIACVIDDFWTGSNSNLWTDKKNWSTKNVPTAADLASVGVINYSGFDPVITANTNAYFVTFGAANSATLTVNSGATFTINNILTINNNAAPIFQGSTATLAGSINIVPAAVVNVTGTGALTISSPLTVTLQSDATGSAQISQMTSGSITGTVSVQRYITGGAGKRGYRLLSSPVSTSAISGIVSINYLKTSCYVTGTTGAAGGFDVGAVNNPSLYLFRENLPINNSSFTAGNYRGVNNLLTAPAYGIDIDGAGFNIYDGNGYLFFFRGDRSKTTLALENAAYVPTSTTLTATGTLNQGQIAVKHWYTGSTALLETTISGSNSVEGFNLVGNPYASSINWDSYSISLPNTTGIYAPGVAPFLYILMPNGNYNVYQANTGGTSTGGIANSNVIPSGQGFFVQATGANPSITFNESAKVVTQATGANLFLGAPPKPIVSQYLHLLLAKDSVNQEGVLVNFNDAANAKYVPNEDALYKTGSGPASLTSLSADNIALAINTLPLPKLAGAIVPLNVNANADGIYQLNMAEIKSIPAIYDIWLMDAYKKDSADMRHNPVYSFNILKSDQASFGPNRFSLVIRQNPALGVHLLDFTANKTSGGAQVVWKTENEQNYTNFTIERSSDGGVTFDALGAVASSALGTYSLLDKNPPHSADQYRLKIEDLNGSISYSNVVTLIYGNSGSTVAGNINVYPNPASNVINLTINEKKSSSSNLSGLLSLGSVPSLAANSTNKAALYDIKIVSVTGSVIKTVTSSSANWQGNVTGLAPGTYFIQVNNKNDKSLVGRNTFVKL